ncbi:PQQ-like beta-propeller repeat protein [Streptomyces sp. LP11]|uniref:PQQ-like beta-propeller repeat protein n=1 Tax=Streptomyces pyxinicus TaxID=2970331 RepID=A0ABT2B6M4_9ACTN|nr:PQQ-like beta-propeller repeat protein [Streptomyces sp. LP11]MCS0604168.1 PQQ-like beta-propeller repeat protein [Streptomyces sp. LP11]
MHDPPTTFAVGHGSMMPETAVAGRLSVAGTLKSDLPVALYRGTAFVASTDRLQAVDTATGQITATVRPQGKPVGSGSEWDTVLASAPVLATAQGTEMVITPFVVRQTGTGTRADHTVVEITAVNATTGRLIWRLTLRPPHWDDVYSDLRTSVVGAEGGVAVVRVSTQSGDHAMAYGIDLGTSRRTWAVGQFQAGAVAGGSVVGTALDDNVGIDQRPAGFDLTSGRLRWRGEHSTDVGTAPAGPRLVRVAGRDYDSGDAYDRLVDPGSGRTVRTMPADLAGAGCTYDERSTLVCSGKGTRSQTACGLDTSTGKVLWQLPDRRADRIAPVITTAWHGRVYGTTDHGPVALDARTGKDLPNPGAAPFLVNESAGLALDKGGSNLIVYPTSG